MIDGRTFTLEVADTAMERARGLMDRESLPTDAAMLFVYDQELTLTFWMKNTLIPLDILFLDALGSIVDIQAMVPEPGVIDSKLKRYKSTKPAQHAIEMNAGLAEKYGLVADMLVTFE